MRFLKSTGLLLLGVLMGISGGREATALQIAVVQPSAQERLLASTRDFYVVCSLDREGMAPALQPFNLRFEVYRQGIPTPLRTVTSAVDASGVTPANAVLTNYENGFTPGSAADILASPPPDLVYDPLRPVTIYDPAIKAVVSERYGAALIQGGCTKQFDSAYATAYTQDLTDGNYTLAVSAVGPAGELLARTTVPLTFGTVPSKIIARFSPADHLARIQTFAVAQNSHLYLDLLPGYWDASKLPGKSTGALFYEIVRRWRPNDTLEYQNGNVLAVIYNIHATSATQGVEIGGMAAAQRLVAPILTCYHYDIGDPAVSYDEGAGRVARKEGTIVPFGTNDRLVLTRAEIRGDGVTDVGGADYLYSPDLADKHVDWNLTDGVTARSRQLLSLFGVVVPIQPALTDVVANPDGTYTANNRIATVRYRVMEGTVELQTFDRRVELTRLGVNNRPSIYEFRHDLPLSPDFAQKTLTVSLSALDSRGIAVAGTDETFHLTVVAPAPETVSGGSGGGCATGVSPLVLLLALPMLPGILRSLRRP